MSLVLLKLLVFMVGSLVCATLCFYIVRPLLRLGYFSSSTRCWLSIAGLAYLLSVLSLVAAAFQTDMSIKPISLAAGAQTASYGFCCIARGLNASEAKIEPQKMRVIFLIGLAGVIAAVGVVVCGMFPT